MFTGKYEQAEAAEKIKAFLCDLHVESGSKIVAYTHDSYHPATEWLADKDCVFISGKPHKETSLDGKKTVLLKKVQSRPFKNLVWISGKGIVYTSIHNEVIGVKVSDSNQMIDTVRKVLSLILEKEGRGEWVDYLEADDEF